MGSGSALHRVGAECQSEEEDEEEDDAEEEDVEGALAAAAGLLSVVAADFSPEPADPEALLLEDLAASLVLSLPRLSLR